MSAVENYAVRNSAQNRGAMGGLEGQQPGIYILVCRVITDICILMYYFVHNILQACMYIHTI